MRRLALFLTLFAASLLTGCQTPPVAPPEEVPKPPDMPDISREETPAPDPFAILAQMVTAYRVALAYSDQATFQIIGTVSPPDGAQSGGLQPETEPVSWKCSVAFQRPNRLRLEIQEGIFVSDGGESYAQIQSLPDQVLRFPAPEQWTFETLFQDVHLDDAMQLGLPPSVFRFPPQLVLLFANAPLNTFIPRGARVEWLEQQSLGHAVCDVIQISHFDGSRILWICQENNVLRRMDYKPVGLPVPEGFESIEALRIEMTDARFDGIFIPAAFQIVPPQDSVYVAAFHSGTSEMPAAEAHRQRLKLMTDSDVFRLVDPQSVPPDPSPPPRTAPRTFTLTPVWTQPLAGVDTMAVLPESPPKLLIPFEGNVLAVLDLQGNVLQRIEPEGLKDTLIMNIKVNNIKVDALAGDAPDEAPHRGRRMGMVTLDGKFYFYDESFKPLALQEVAAGAEKPEVIRDFLFFPCNGEELLLLAVQQNETGVLRAFDLQGTLRWEYHFEGEPKQMSSATAEGRDLILLSRTTSQDSILQLFSDGTQSEPVEILFGRDVLWFHILGATLYTMWENMDTGDIRFLGLDRQGKSQWSRLLPAGEYEVHPVSIPSERKWLVPLPSGEFFVFDTIGNMLDTFSLNIVPTGLLCVEVNGETFLIIADGETVSAWKMR